MADQEIITRETVGGVELAEVDPLPVRTVELSLPPVGANPTSYELIPHVATLARMVARTEFVPAVYRDRPAAVAAAMLMGHEIGIPPMTALRHITITEPDDKGKSVIVISAQIMRAVVLSKGHRLWYPEVSSRRVTVAGQRRGEEEITRVTWDWSDAERAKPKGWTSDYSPWKKYPRAMLTARATAELCRLVFADALGGVAYVPEEIEDGVPDEASSVRNEDGTLPPPEPTETVTHARKRKSAKIEAGAAVSPEAAAPPSPGATETWRDLPVPGDDVPEAVAPTVPPPAASPSPPPTASASSAVSVDASGQATLDVALDKFPAAPEMQQSAATPHVARKEIEHLATLCREAKIDRHAVAQAVSGGRTESTRSLTPQEVANALDRVRAVQRGEVRLTVDLGPGEVPRFEGVDEDADLNLGLLTRLKAYRDADEHGFWQLLKSFGWKAGVTNTTVTEFVKALTREQRLAMYDRVPAQ